MFSNKIINDCEETSLSFCQSSNIITNLINFLDLITENQNESLNFIFVELIEIIFEMFINLKKMNLLNKQDNNKIIEIILQKNCIFKQMLSLINEQNIKIRFYSNLLCLSLTKNDLDIEKKDVLYNYSIMVNKITIRFLIVF